MPAVSERPPFFRRILAGGCVALIVALAAFGANPRWHERLHPGQPLGEGDGCAIVLFAAGVALTLALTVMVPVLVEWPELPAVTQRKIFLLPPRYLRQPERGPPMLG
jgi:hypothetical protein